MRSPRALAASLLLLLFPGAASAADAGGVSLHLVDVRVERASGLTATAATLDSDPAGDLVVTGLHFTSKAGERPVRGWVPRLTGNVSASAWRFDAARLSIGAATVHMGRGAWSQSRQRLSSSDGVRLEHAQATVTAPAGKVLLGKQRVQLGGGVRGTVRP